MISQLPLVLRRSVVVLVTGLTSLGLSVVLAAPAMAEPSEGWPDSEPASATHALLVFVGLPVLLFLVVTLAVLLPAMVRGERLTPGRPVVENQWLGGPRRSAGELAAPDGETSEAGGASGRW
ncbi:hypothetical protein LRP67_17280 [Nocardioides sp. cx-169]|uniref:hypothetical protein n=1 Tax=Nocardioides sp. cx-169 TaxID=2899080 RepID=UPI001E4011B6|nr:hypothetical protein [Nocardioides sp. cx-169]MCD4535845.1 hypothetical protein [Nocardioides sp. cx-169]